MNYPILKGFISLYALVKAVTLRLVLNWSFFITAEGFFDLPSAIPHSE